MENVKTKFINRQRLPLVIEPKQNNSFAALIDYIRSDREIIAKKLLTFGGLLFRGFAIDGAEAFNTVIKTLGLGELLSYVGGDSPRTKVQGNVYTSTEVPASFNLPLHNEMSFIKNYPSHIYFYCDIPAETGGETIIADARAVYKAVDPKIKERFVNGGLKYVSNFYGHSKVLDILNRFQRCHKSWMEAFETNDKVEVEKRCLENEFGYKWGSKDWLQVTYETPSVIAHPKTGERVWFNQAHLFDYNPRLLGLFNWMGAQLLYVRKNTVLHEVYHGNGQPIIRKDLYHVMDVLEQKTLRFPWQKGDMMVLDNVLTMHGRASFTGKRRILAALTR